jgi:dTDP-glucose pyrophosphorylase
MNWKDALVRPDQTIKHALEAISRSSIQVAVIVEKDGVLKGIATDGDIRRAILNGIPLENKIEEVMNTSPTTIHEGISNDEAIGLMREKRLHQIPVLNSHQQVVDVLLFDELTKPDIKENHVVIMAGGLGQRLRPLTENCPKPMLEVGGKPILETIIEQFKKHGFRKFYISLNYLPEKIVDYFEDGTEFDCEISYLFEKEKMGTAGSLSLIKKRLEKPFFVMNGDLLTKVNFDQLLEFHLQNESVATMGVRDYDFQIPYGVVNSKGHEFIGVQEKPIERYFVNAGIYLLEPKVLSIIEPNKPLGMTSLFEKLADRGDKATVFPIREYWMDIGRPSEFEKANKDYRKYFN